MDLFQRQSKLRRNVAVFMSVLMLCSAFPMGSVYATADEVAQQPTTEEAVITVPEDSQEVVVTPLPDKTEETPDDPTPDEPTPDEPTPDDPTPDEPTPDEPTPDEPTPDDPTPDEPTPTTKEVVISVPENKNGDQTEYIEVGEEGAENKIWFSGTQGSFVVTADGGFKLDGEVIKDFEITNQNENIDYIVEYNEETVTVTMKCKEGYQFAVEEVGQQIEQTINVFGQEKKLTFYIDNAEPVVDTDNIVYEAKKNGETVDFDENNKYQTVTVKVPVSDLGTGIGNVTIYETDTKQTDTKLDVSTWVENGVDSNDKGIVYHCFNASEGKKTYTVELTDRVGNKAEVSTKEIKVDSTSPTAPTVILNDVDDENENAWYNTPKGITVTGIEDGCNCVVTLNEDKNKVYEGSAKDGKISVDPNNITYNQGENTYKVTITDEAGNSTTVSKSFNFDNVAPIITKYEIEKAESTTAKILTFLTFGIYSNTKLNVTVYATDPNGENGSGLENINLYNQNSEELLTDDDCKQDDGSSEYKKTFALNAKADKYILSAQCVDNAGNDSKKIPLSQAKFDNAIAEGFEVVVVDSKYSAQGVITVTPNADTVYYPDTNAKKDWYSGNVTYKFTAVDELVGISSIKVTLNDKDVTKYCVDNENNELPIQFNAVEDTTMIKATVPSETTATVANQKVKSKEITLDTSNVDCFNQVENTLEVTVTNNVGKSDTFTKVIYRDTTPAEINGTVSCNATENVTDYVDSENKHWYSGNVTFNVNAEDTHSGIKSVEVKLKGKDVTGKCTIEGDSISKSISLNTADVTDIYTENDNTLTVTVTNNVGKSDTFTKVIYRDTTPADIKGTVSCNATENVTDYVDSEKKHWYSGNVTFNVNAKDEDTGIKSVEVKLKGKDVKDVKDVTDKCTIEGDSISKSISLNTADVTDIYTENDNTLTVTVTNNVGKSDTFTKVIYRDTTPADIKGTVSCNPTENVTDYVDSEKKHWYSGNVTFNVNAKDTHSGIASQVVKLNGNTLEEGQYLISGNSADKQITLETTKVADYYNEGKNTLTVDVTDNVGNSNSNSKESKEFTNVIYLDQTKPQITKYRVEKAETETDEILTFLTFGIYSNTKLNVTVYAIDPYVDSNKTLYSGVKDIALYNGDSTELTKVSDIERVGDSNEYKKTFTIEASENKYILSADCIDNVENKSEKINLSDASFDSDIEAGFEVVVVNGEHKAILQDDEISVTANADTKYYYDKSAEFEWYSDDVTYEFTAVDELVGISSIKVTLNDKDVTKNCKEVGEEDATSDMPTEYNSTEPTDVVEAIVATEAVAQATAPTEEATVAPTEATEDTTSVSTKKVTSKTISFDTASVDSSTYKQDSNELVVSVFDNTGKEHKFNRTIYLDQTSPQITKFEVTKASKGLASQILTFLTFGIYSDNNLNVTVYAQDPYISPANKRCSGVKDIELYNGDSTKPMNGFGFERVDNSNKYKKTFTIKASEDKYVLSAKCFDNVGNESEQERLSDAQFNGNVTIADGFEVVVTTQPPTLSNITVNKNVGTDYCKIGTKSWYSNDVTFDFTAEDTLAGIGSINVMLNGADVTTSCVDTNGTTLPTKFNSINNASKVEAVVAETATIANQKVTKETVKLNTADVSEHYVEGANTLKVTVTNNVGKKTEKECTIYYDKTSPRVTDFLFTPKGIEEGAENTDPIIGVDSDDSNYKSYTASLIQETTYGFYFKTDTTVTVFTADKDESGNADGCGVKYIYFWCVSKDGELTSSSYFDVNGETSASFTVPAGFKGRVYAFAVDKVNNSINRGNQALYNNNYKALKGVEPDGVVLETLAQHTNDARVAISRPQATKTTASGSPLYNDTVDLTLEAYDPHSGIRQITYTIEGTNPSPAKNYIITDTVDVGIDGGVSYQNNSAIWGNKSTDGNLVTYLSTTIPVDFNCDNIKVTLILTDRAGYTSTATDSFSIDTVNPQITVEYVPEQLKDGIYCNNRKATITVKERNFDASLVDCKITNTDGYIPQIEWIKTEGVGDDTVNIANINYNRDGDYVFDISCEDRAGNKSVDENHAEFTVDNTAPTITVTYDNNDAKNVRYFNKDRIATIVVVEHNFDPSTAPNAVVKLKSFDSKDNSKTIANPEISKWVHTGDRHTVTVKFDKDGYYNLSVEYTDLADNKATDIRLPEPKSFYIDKTNPQLEIVGVKSEKAYNETVTPIVKMSDDNYDSKGYKVTFDRTDIKAKQGKLTANNTPVNEVHNAQDGTVTFATLGDKTGKDDSVYLMKAIVTDKAGNVSEQTVNFSMNRLGSQYVYSEDYEDSENMKKMLNSGYRSYDTASDIVVEEINVSAVKTRKITMSVDGGSYRELVANEDYTVVDEHPDANSWHKYIYTIPKEIFKEDGYYTIILSSSDEAGNEADNKTPKNNNPIELSFTIDNIKPNISIIGLVDKTEDGNGYLEGELLAETSKEVQVICEDTNIDINNFDIYLDNKKLERDSADGYTIEKDAYTITARLTVYAAPDRSAQTLRVVARDLAENENENSVKKFVLSATLLMRFFNNPVLVILAVVLIFAITVTIIIIVAKKKKRKV